MYSLERFAISEPKGTKKDIVQVIKSGNECRTTILSI